MTYESAAGLRMALERRLRERSTITRLSLDRLRRRLVMERMLTRLEAAEPGRWVLKGGMAMEVRLPDAARLTKDIDLGLRGGDVAEGELHERLIAAMNHHGEGDHFALSVGRPTALRPDGAGVVTWRLKVVASLAGKFVRSDATRCLAAGS